MRLDILILLGLYCFGEINSDTHTSLTKKEIDAIGNKNSPRDKIYLFPPPLVAPYGGVLKLLMGISIPISLTGGRILSFASNFQFQYPLPQNATFFTRYFDDSTGRTRRTIANKKIEKSINDDRFLLYRSLEQSIERCGGNGKSCMLKSICQAAENSLKDQGLVGQLIDLVLTPNYETGSELKNVKENDYSRAFRTGKMGEDCFLHYPGCPEGLLERISKLD